MAENENDNDEYKFEESDLLERNPLDESDSDYYSETEKEEQTTPIRSTEGTDIRRKALLVIGVIIFIMVMYKFIGYLFFSENKEAQLTEPTPALVKQVAVVEPIQPDVSTQSIQKIQQVQSSLSETEKELENKVSSIEASQQSLRAELSTLNDQIGSINNNINSLSTQVANLNQIVSNLSNQLAAQADAMQKVVVRPQPKRVIRLPRHATEQIIYNVQAIIPGRAWLIGSNGSTITVREGTRIAGYGVVKLIDSMQGRVLTSSGRIIKFSQEDS